MTNKEYEVLIEMEVAFHREAASFLPVAKLEETERKISALDPVLGERLREARLSVSR